MSTLMLLLDMDGCLNRAFQNHNSGQPVIVDINNVLIQHLTNKVATIDADNVYLMIFSARQSVRQNYHKPSQIRDRPIYSNFLKNPLYRLANPSLTMEDF